MFLSATCLLALTLRCLFGFAIFGFTTFGFTPANFMYLSIIFLCFSSNFFPSSIASLLISRVRVKHIRQIIKKSKVYCWDADISYRSLKCIHKLSSEGFKYFKGGSNVHFIRFERKYFSGKPTQELFSEDKFLRKVSKNEKWIMFWIATWEGRRTCSCMRGPERVHSCACGVNEGGGGG